MVLYAPCHVCYDYDDDERIEIFMFFVSQNKNRLNECPVQNEVSQTNLASFSPPPLPLNWDQSLQGGPGTRPC